MYYVYHGFVHRVIDGDSCELLLDLGFSLTIKETARVWGIDTAEIRGYKDEPQLKQLGKLASQFFKDKVEAQGNAVTVKTHLSKGKYGRLLAEIFWGEEEESLGDLLVAAKLAVPYYGQGKGDIRQAHMANLAFHLQQGNIHGED
tara:strand:+ start:29 stop:463 length:435 start_codon:yes stop_codon:yes gene_type:complete